MISRITTNHCLVAFLFTVLECCSVFGHELDAPQSGNNAGVRFLKEQSLPTTVIAKFYRLAKTYSSEPDSPSELRAFVDNLNESDQITLASVLLTDREPIFSSLGIILALRNHRFDLAVPKLKFMAAAGEDLSEFYWYLEHVDYITDKELLLKEIEQAR